MTFQPVDKSTPDRGAAMPEHPSNPPQQAEERDMNDMTQDCPSEPEVRPETPRRKWLPLAVALAVGAGVLGWEYRETLYPLLGSPVLFLLVCVGMHFLMHRGHGGHGGGGSGS